MQPGGAQGGAVTHAPATAMVPLLAMTILVGAGIRFYELGQQSIWNDEAYSIALSSSPVSAIVASVIADHLPLYFLLLHAWMTVFGQGEFAVRSLSALFGVLTVPASYALGGKLFNRKVGFVCALITAFSPFLIYYSQETRMYSLVALEAVTMTYALVSALNGRRTWWFVYAATGIALLYTHYYGLLFIVSQAMYVAGWVWLNRRAALVRRAIVPAALAAIVLAIAFLP